VRIGWYRAVHVKSEDSHRFAPLLIQRHNLERKFVDIENSTRHSLKAFGIRLHLTGRQAVLGAIWERIGDAPLLLAMLEPMFEVRAVMWHPSMRPPIRS
jgi:transposase